MQQEEPAHLLDDLPLGEVRFFSELPSTNTSALEWLAKKPAEYSLLVADRQTAGHGRFHRAWHAAAGASLSFSLILYPSPIEQDVLALFSALAALAVTQALESFHPSTAVQIKWPNDVLLDGKKCCGVLCEATWQADSLGGLVIGIGVNVGRRSLPPVQDLLFPVACLQDALDPPPQRWKVLHAILQNLIELREIFPSPLFLSQWQERLAFLNQAVTISNGDQKTEGVFTGTAANGDLLLRQKNGRQLVFPLGDVSLRPLDSGMK